MTDFFMFLTIITMAAAPLCGQHLMPDPQAYRITSVSIADVRANKVIPAQDVYIRDGRIVRVQPSGSQAFPGEWRPLDGTGKFLMPGISEMHAHIPVPRDGDDSNVRETLFLYLSNGITTIRGMLGNPYHLELKEMIARDEVLSPRVYTSSPSLNGNSVQTPEEAQRKVTQYATDGYDFLKIHPGIALPVMERLVSTAQAEGIPFAGHVPHDVGVRRALAFGYASIDHADGYIEGLMPPGTDLNQ
ncbi:MAG: amidohydrolase family protein, partial [Saprospiraceae bacterium]|nr:amidohydrolase family protein [Saprospiraceae bacterium]